MSKIRFAGKSVEVRIENNTQIEINLDRKTVFIKPPEQILAVIAIFLRITGIANIARRLIVHGGLEKRKDYSMSAIGSMSLDVSPRYANQDLR
jgi:hypothetical protein